MSWIDWAIVAVPMVIVLYIAVKTNAYMKGVSDFLAAGRVAGRYLVCTASGMATMGVISVVAVFEMRYKAGYAIGWWSQLATPVWLIITLTGFVIYRYRETRAMTLAQFFEMRYSRKFRIFAGFLAATAGIINFGIFPAVAGRFFVYYCGLPEYVGPIPTFAIVMLVFLGSALLFVLLGGQLTILVTDCVQGLFAYAMYLIVAMTLLYLFSWHQITSALMSAPEKQSLLNPFKTSEMADFNIWFVLIGIFAGIYGLMAWQGTSGFNCSAASAHEQKMGGILGNWRGLVFEVMQTLLAICALTYMTNHDFAAGAASVRAAVANISDPQIQTQMTVPLALSHFLPIGIKGVFAALMFFLACTNDVSYLHSWGSIVVQDVVMPLRKKPLSPKAHLALLRWSITGVTIFAFCFSLFFKQTQYIYMYFALTGAIFLGGAGSVIIGGLYWKKGTTAGAWSGMIVGSSLAVGAFLAPFFWKPLFGTDFPINGQYMAGISMGSAILTYVLVSLATCRQDFNLNQMLHRGQYAVDESGRPAPKPDAPPRTWKAFLGIDENFTKGDKILATALFCWSMGWFSVFAVISIWNLISVWPDKWWANYWYITGIILPLVLGVVTSIWFTIGSARDLRLVFVRLANLKRDSHDDGSVPQAVLPVEASATAEASDPRETAVLH